MVTGSGRGRGDGGVGGGEEGQTEEKSFHAKFIVACDGGTSFVRKALNVYTHGKFDVARAVSIMFN